MTTPTDAELDALVETSNSLNCCHDTQHESGDEGPNNRCLFCGHRFADAITALRAELAAERAKRFEWLAKRHKISSLNWLRAAKKARDGDWRELQNRIDLAEADPVQIVLSDETAATKGATK